MKRTSTRRYNSLGRRQAAEQTRDRVLAAARKLFVRYGIDRVTIAQIAEAGGVAPSTVYALHKSKDGILRALMRGALFGERFQIVQSMLQDVADPVRLVALSAHVARAVYESESKELGLIRGSSAFSPALRKLEQEFERIRLDMQEERVRRLFDEGRQKPGLSFDDARRILWMYTSRDVYRMLVNEGGWSPDKYQEWLSQTLLAALVADPGSLGDNHPDGANGTSG
jgi:AcrR family transcriptional regulator